MIRLLAAVALSVLAACATTTAATTDAQTAAKPAAPVRVARSSYSIPLPQGWEEVAAAQAASVVGAEGIVVANPTLQPLPEFMTASIYVKGIQGLDVDPKSATDCEKVATDISKAMQSKVDGSRIVQLPISGDTCQVDVTAEQNANVRVRSTIVHAASTAWMVTCRFDSRDPSAVKDCDNVLNGFQLANATAAAATP